MLYTVEFKAGRTDICYIMQGDNIEPQVGDLVIVEADRGRDIGKVTSIQTANDIMKHHHQQDRATTTTDRDSTVGSTGSSSSCHVKRLYRLADADEVISLATKQLDEEKALLVCQTKIQQKQLPMQVVNAEYQWDRRKLTFYFLADQRIDFRELVRELFKTYKTRIWMCALNSNSSNGASTNE
ncbi:PSP1 C-terminal conserved region-domain-containing protein [Halteromyces radiatus]|uniref:PSP1 C-terminal conserved region-domain-containing protein n=1 Tax=Halteromyces radiatus TaxID=101107 RepID=UPI002220E952|nr:PSP1 C-terminal conserved region-domain-containing protein [Halteromyces radiatus]KAI8076734.1 PSP1 C-terminal conserved region-domain-containing protein [Halteromyces radiatus]